ncbi:MAG: alanine--tRNA ligase [Acidobacteria bacterium]|nr:alanine--tRNA ligase [Acidobacteriota bacterium]
MEGKKLRQLFLDYFKEKNHHVVRSSSLVPAHDPTLLFANAGMNQFKEVFLGAEKREYNRATSAQKCVRAGGKHNDLDNVGKTARHHTFFEMLGNFSFGDYFKEDAIRYAWDFITEILKIDKNRLYVSVFRDDDEAFDIWNKKMHIPVECIFRFGEKDNFWQMGDVGPCGPCSEIFYDHGEEYGCGKPTCTVGCECDRYVEIWNLVFMQFSRDTEGHMTPLPSPSIDTGMGLERLAAVMQGVNNNYDTDLFQNIIRDIAKKSGHEYGVNHGIDTAMRVLADHMRATVFLITDDVVPSNEGRGYVLRRIMRRAIRYGKKLDLPMPSLYRFVDTVTEEMGGAYPELTKNRKTVAKLVRIEEEQFDTTLEAGLKMLNRMIEKSDGKLDAENAFRLYDTFGFPIDLVEDVCLEKHISVDREGFEQRLEQQRKEGKARSKTRMTEISVENYLFLHDFPETEFTGYDSKAGTATVLAIVRDGKQVKELIAGETGKVLVDRTPFYVESGGQVNDTGILETAEAKGVINRLLMPIKGRRLHVLDLTKGKLKVDETVTLTLDSQRRFAIARNHTATHLLHAALRSVLGDHVKQAGSMVEPDKLRFDFSHFKKISEQELAEVEQIVNRKIMENIPVETEILDIEEARAAGAMALFGEKYGDRVRVVRVPGYSMELCGGTHVTRTGDIGSFVIVSEHSAASGIRRIEAKTGFGALGYFNSFREEHRTLKQVLKTGEDDLPQFVARKLEEIRQLRQAIEKAKVSDNSTTSTEVRLDSETTLLLQEVPGLAPGLMREKADNLKQNRKKTIVFLLTVTDSGCNYLLSATRDMEKHFHSGNALRSIAPMLNGRGGGNQTMAQGGGKWIGKLTDIVETVVAKLKNEVS